MEKKQSKQPLHLYMDEHGAHCIFTDCMMCVNSNVARSEKLFNFVKTLCLPTFLKKIFIKIITEVAGSMMNVKDDRRLHLLKCRMRTGTKFAKKYLIHVLYCPRCLILLGSPDISYSLFWNLKVDVDQVVVNYLASSLSSWDIVSKKSGFVIIQKSQSDTSKKCSEIKKCFYRNESKEYLPRNIGRITTNNIEKLGFDYITLEELESKVADKLNKIKDGTLTTEELLKMTGTSVDPPSGVPFFEIRQQISKKKNQNVSLSDDSKQRRKKVVEKKTKNAHHICSDQFYCYTSHSTSSARKIRARTSKKGKENFTVVRNNEENDIVEKEPEKKKRKKYYQLQDDGEQEVDGDKIAEVLLQNSSTSGQNVVENKCVNKNDNQAKDNNQDVQLNNKKKTLQRYSSDGHKKISDISCTCKSCGLHGYLAERQVSEEPNLSLSNSVSSDNFTSGTYAPNMPDKQLRKELYQSVYNPGYKPLPDAPHVWAKHSNALNRVVAKQNTNPRRWSNEEVIKFIQGVPNCKDIGSIFRKHSIDGEAFLMLTQEDLVKLLGLRLGPAIKLYNSIVLLRRRVT